MIKSPDYHKSPLTQSSLERHLGKEYSYELDEGKDFRVQRDWGPMNKFLKHIAKGKE